MRRKLFLRLRRVCCLFRVPQLTVIILGTMLSLLPANAQQSNSSGEHLTIWTQLSAMFEQSLNQHEQTLNELSGRLRTSEANGQKLTSLSDELLRQNEDLRNYNQQIGERMQERDEDIASAYDRIDELEKRFLKAVIVIIALGAIIAVVAAVKIIRLFLV
jgi:sensor c-di-GMP phosphodiesterase-like protein